MYNNDKRIFIALRTTTYESNNHPYTSNTLKIRCILVRAFEHASHVHVAAEAAMLPSDAAEAPIT